MGQRRATVNAILAEVRRTLALAVPIIIGQVSQMLIGITDSAMIGRVGAVPLAASALTGSLFGVFLFVGIGLLLPVAVLVARDHGGGRSEVCREWLRHGLAVGAAASGLMIAVMAGLWPLLPRWGQPPEVLAAMGGYYALIVGSLLPALVFQVLRQYAESLGQPWVPMGIMLAGVGLNAGLNWVLIYGHLGAPALGLAGAGWATLLARWVSVVAVAGWIARARVRLPGAWPRRWAARLEPARLREMMAIGLPAAATLLFESGAFAAAATMMGWLGARALAAHQIALSCAAFTFMFPLGLSMAVSIRIGQEAGRGRRDVLRPVGFGALGLSCVVMGSFAIVFAFSGHRIAGWFIDDPAVAGLAGRLLAVAAVFQLFDGGQVVGMGMLRGLADVKVPAAITFGAYWLLALPAGFVLGVHGPLGPVGVWWGLAGGLACASVLLAWRFARLTGPGTGTVG